MVMSYVGRTACTQRMCVQFSAATTSVGLYTSIAFCKPVHLSIVSKTLHGPFATSTTSYSFLQQIIAATQLSVLMI